MKNYKLRNKILRKVIKEEIENQGRNFDYGNQKSDTDEGKMMKKSLLMSAKDLVELHQFLQDQDDLPTWCHNYIAIARDRISTVKDYLTTKEEK